jgi:hypothetical protein
MRRGGRWFGNGFFKNVARRLRSERRGNFSSLPLRSSRYPLAAKLTRRAEFDLIAPLQPKSGFLPEAGCGGTKFPVMGWGERSRATGCKATFKAKPVS